MTLPPRHGRLRRLFTASAAAATLALTGCAQAQAKVASAAEVPPPGAVPGPALWKVSDADTTIYLFGTVHALPKDKPWFDNRIATAFRSADELVTEIDVSNVAATAQALAGQGALPKGQVLRTLMTPDNRQQYEAALVSLGLPVETLDPYEPWFAAMTLSLLPLLKSGYDAQSGVEVALASEKGPSKHSGLETIDQQIALFDTMPQDQQLSFLDQTVEAIPKAGVSLDAMVAEWIKGDAGKLAELLNAELTDAALRERLLTQRNANWARWVQQRLGQPGTVFVAVGAGHLAGQGSVQDQLRKTGIKVQRIWR
ncbi:MAG: TraB/GumN family protein [Croceibacterium sp.]